MDIKWEDYDIMKYRWKYIKAQTLEYCDSGSMILPSSYEKSVEIQPEEFHQTFGFDFTNEFHENKISPIKVQGSVPDLRKFAKTSSSASQRPLRIAAQTGLINTRRSLQEERLNTRAYHINTLFRGENGSVSPVRFAKTDASGKTIELPRNLRGKTVGTNSVSTQSNSSILSVPSYYRNESLPHRTVVNS